MRDPGVVPVEETWTELSGEVASCRDDFVLLRTQVCAHDALVESPSIVTPDLIVSIKDLSTSIDHVAQVAERQAAHQARRQNALSVLDQLLALVHSDKREFAPLLECQTTAHALRESLAEPSRMDDAGVAACVDALVTGDHPYAQLLTLVAIVDSADDDEVEALRASVAEALGPALSVAAVRGKLHVAADVLLTPPSPISSSHVAPTGEIAALVDVTVGGAESTDVEQGIASPDVTIPPDENPLAAQSASTTTETDDSIVDGTNSGLFDVIEEDVQAQSAPINLTTTADATATIGLGEAADDADIKRSNQPHSQGDLLSDEGIEGIAVETLVAEDATEQVMTLDGISSSPVPSETFAHETAQTIAWGLLHGSNITWDDPDCLQALAGRLLLEDHPGLAYHVVCYLERFHPDSQPRFPSWLIHAVILAPHVRYDMEDIATLLKADYDLFDEALLDDASGEWNTTLRYLLIAAALRPALLAPHSGASTLLRHGPLHDLCEEIADYGDRFPALNPLSLRQVHDLAAWQADLVTLQQEVDDWYTHARQMKLLYQGATAVWLEWLRSGLVIDTLLLPVREDDTKRLHEVQAAIGHWSKDSAIRSAVDQTDRKTLHRRLGAAIEARAYQQIVKHVGEAIGYARRWVALHESRQGEAPDYLQQRAEKVRSTVHKQYEQALATLDVAAAADASSSLRASLWWCRRAVEDVRALFSTNVPLTVTEPVVQDLLHADLLRIPSVSLNARWEPTINGELVHSILSWLASSRIDWRLAFEAQAEQHDHEATQRLIEHLMRLEERGVMVNCSLPIDELQRLRERYVRECQEIIKDTARDVSGEVENALAFGLIGEQERRGLDRRVVAARDAAATKTTYRFDELLADLEDVRRSVDEKRRAGIERVRESLESQRITADHPDYGRIISVLDRGDVLTANDYIRLVLHKEPLPTGTAESVFDSFFPKTYTDILTYLKPKAPAPKLEPRKIIEDVRRRDKGLPVDMSGVSEEQAGQAVPMLEAWFIAKKSRSIERGYAHTILTALGFSFDVPGTGMQIEPPKRRTWITVSVEPVRAAERCPVPAYGSDANGRYRILCIWDEPTEEDLINSITGQPSGEHVIVFYFGCLSVQQRRNLARLSRTQRRAVIVVDDTLLLGLCAVTGARLPRFFAYTLPFTFVEPYMPTAGLVAPEMFYGRKVERDDIIAPRGTCFIFGGRQLGKTALLRDVERTEHKPDQGQIVLWIDLNDKGMRQGGRRSVDEIWLLIAEELAKVSDISVSRQAREDADAFSRQAREDADAFEERIKAAIDGWLRPRGRHVRAFEQRRILLLLDEADFFLEADTKAQVDRPAFKHTTSLKGLMERTERRFKVVFAGLHNVQRTTTLENHPLAHYGDPRCIGPLSPGDARDLIEHPMLSMGYQFKDPDLVTRILSQTNYYPSLIQLYCNELLKHLQLQQPGRFGVEAPPYVIEERHVDEAYRRQSLREAIRNRFVWTLQLDKRYEVIAYLIALAAVQDPRCIVPGLSVSWIRERALNAWPQGFTETTTADSFRALLDELVGLGVLVEVGEIGEGYYTLRSPNVLTLLGTEEEIRAKLDDPRDPPAIYEVEHLRAPFDDHHVPWRSPLTLAQESVLRSRRNDITVLVGSKACGIESVEAYLRTLFGVAHEQVRLDRDFGDMSRHITQLAQRLDENTTGLVIVPESYNTWDEDWIEITRVALREVERTDVYVRVVFLADSGLLWRLLDRAGPALERMEQMLESTVVALAPWHESALRQWIDEDSGLVDIGPPKREAIIAATGKWPVLLRRFYDQVSSSKGGRKDHIQAIAGSLSNVSVASELVAVFGLTIPDVRKVLNVLADLGEDGKEEEATSDDLVSLAEGVEAAVVQRVLRWAHLLSIVRTVGNGGWSLDPIVGQVLRAHSN